MVESNAYNNRILCILCQWIELVNAYNTLNGIQIGSNRPGYISLTTLFCFTLWIVNECVSVVWCLQPYNFVQFKHKEDTLNSISFRSMLSTHANSKYTSISAYKSKIEQVASSDESMTMWLLHALLTILFTMHEDIVMTYNLFIFIRT